MYFKQQQEINNLAIKIAQLKEIERQKQEKEKIIEEKLNRAEQDLIGKVNHLFSNQPYKFKAKLSEDKQYVEIYSQKNILVGKYEQMPQNSLFKAVDGTIAGLERNEEILLGKMKDSLFSIMEGCFR